ncbi:MAG: hypothetical protein ABF636_04565 [Acetobacter sp.]
MSRSFINSRYLAVFLVVVASFSVAVFLDSQIFDDGDVFLHVAAGQWILQHHAVPHVDPFSYSFAGAPWVAHEWLSEVLMALAYGGAGWGGVRVLIGLAYALAMGSMVVFVVQRGASMLAVGLISVCSLSLTFPFLLARPHILALPCFVLWSICLLRAREKGSAPPPWPTALILLVWANLHGSFAIGMLLIFPFALEAILAEKQARLRAVKAWGGFVVLAGVAISLTPNGWHGLLFPVQLVMMPQLEGIREWAPMPIRLTEPGVMAVCALAYVVVTRRLQIPPIRWLLLIGFIYLTIRHIRYELLAAVFVPLIVADPLGQLVPEQQGMRVMWRGSVLQWCVLVAVVAGLTELRVVFPYMLENGPVTPVLALAHVPAELRKQPVLNSYGMGGILIMEGTPPIIDGRADMYGHAFMKEHDAVMAGDKAMLQAWSTEFGLRWAILRPTEMLVNVLDSDPQWTRLYTDRYAIVYVKEKTPAPGL